jgi:phage shock protein PspC (stress-responsive transcriptional regulator)
MNCNEAVAALVASLESGVPMNAEQREHIRTCARCRELLDSAKQFQTLLEGNGIQLPPVDSVAAAAEREVRRTTRWRSVGVVFAIAVVAWTALAIAIVGPTSLSEAALLATLWTGVSFLVVLPLLLLFVLARAAHAPENRLYKRLKPGRQLSGVCLGLAERFRLNLLLVRLAFVAAIFFDGVGFWVYLVLDLAMPVHPDDRQYLLRFRLRRWWARRNGHAEHHAG